MRPITGPAAGLRGGAPWALAAAGLGLALFLWRFDPAVVDPRAVDRVLAPGGDPAMNTLGWEYFRQEPWSWPPGRCLGYGAPFGSSIALVDAIPLVALPGKLLGGGRTDAWQYLGIWHLASCVLQGFVAWLAAGLVLPRPGPRLAAAGLLLLTPSFLARTGHAALTAHWLVLLALVLYGRRAGAGPWLGLLAAVSLCHPYLAAMVAAVGAAALVRSWPGRGARARLRSLALVPAAAAVVLAAWWLSGMFVYGLAANRDIWGYGYFSANLNALVNPLWTSRLLPALPLAGPEQVEGYNYLGLGVLALWGLALAAAAASPEVRRRLSAHAPLLAVMALLALFAVSPRLTLGGGQVFRTELPALAEPLARAFRASGRFLWPVAYGGTLFACWTLQRLCRHRAQSAILASLLALQAFDLGPLLQHGTIFAADRVESRLVDPAWATVTARTERLLTVPPLEAGTQFPYDFRDLDLPLVGRGVPTSAAYLTRSDAAATAAWTAALHADLAAGRALDPGTTVVVRASELGAWLPVLSPRLTVYNLDGFRVAVDSSLVLPGALAYASSRTVDLPAFLAAHRGDTLVLAVRDDATLELGDEARGLLRDRGVAVDELAYRCSFAALLPPDAVTWQAVSTEHDVAYAGDAPRRLEIRSAGLLHGNEASIRLDGVEQAANQRGLNILVLDAEWRPLVLAAFDTFAGTAGWAVDCRRVPD